VGNQSYRLGCDIGGTFTDFVLVNDETGEFQINKCLTTPADPSDAVEQGIQELLELPGCARARQRASLRCL
jgi:N-methylhydantoinase A/oxoprolinase/acetone carboxylase beta subunit